MGKTRICEAETLEEWKQWTDIPKKGTLKTNIPNKLWMYRDRLRGALKCAVWRIWSQQYAFRYDEKFDFIAGKRHEARIYQVVQHYRERTFSAMNVYNTTNHDASIEWLLLLLDKAASLLAIPRGKTPEPGELSRVIKKYEEAVRAIMYERIEKLDSFLALFGLSVSKKHHMGKDDIKIVAARRAFCDGPIAHYNAAWTMFRRNVNARRRSRRSMVTTARTNTRSPRRGN